ncbi:MAG: alanine--tRNA ligase [archaeon]|nr:alanine--tRNA ligase [archaeon]
MDDKALKEQLRKKAQKNPKDYYPVAAFKHSGLSRYQCSICRNYFWSAVERDVCGEPECCGGYSFIGDSPVREKMDFIDVWQRFSKMFNRLGYAPVKRYPSVARWNKTMDFTIASIAGFQPYVVSGEIKPPENPLVIPQFCLRFADIENVGLTGRHYTGFVMIGQHAFVPERDYDINRYFKDIFAWLTKGMRLPKEELVFHEDAWGGGGNFGPSIEFFSRGLEIGNQVYMLYEKGTAGNLKDLDIKVLDMGMGQERPAWLSHGTETSYEANFGPVVKALYRKSGIRPDKMMLRKFLPYSGYLNIDEVDNIEKVWKNIAQKTGNSVKQLKGAIMPLSGIYSICDHTRSLLIALTDGALPSNVGGGYNLRVLYRRSLDFIEKYGWDIDLHDVCVQHAKYLRPQYPELSDNLDGIAQILEIEKKKYYATRDKTRKIVRGLAGKSITTSKLVDLYDSNGISPEMLKASGFGVSVPQDFYSMVTQKHEKSKSGSKSGSKTQKEKKLSLAGIKKTGILYFDNYLKTEFKAKVLKNIGNYTILDRTCFYPTGGGQMHDVGTIGSINVIDVFRQGNIIIHQLEKRPTFSEGSTITGSIDKERRIQLAQHHTATHIINGAARQILGRHIWQAGAEKKVEKARLDITHYNILDEDTVKKIEDLSNDIVKSGTKVESLVLARDVAEKKYGFRLYQGGAVPGAELRVVKIADFDIEACGGTHLKNTKEAGSIKILGTRKIQDGVIRLEFVAGKRAEAKKQDFSRIIDEILGIADTDNRKNIISGCTALFKDWKDLRKIANILVFAKRVEKSDPEKCRSMVAGAKLMYSRYMSQKKVSNKEDIGSDEQIIITLMQIFHVPRDNLISTLKRFRSESGRFRKIIGEMIKN